MWLLMVGQVNGGGGDDRDKPWTVVVVGLQDACDR
jgi:hypothetical protein